MCNYLCIQDKVDNILHGTDTAQLHKTRTH